MADIITSSGTRIYIGAAGVSTAYDTLAEFLAVSAWTEVGLVESIGEFGDKSNTVTFAAINDSRMRKAKGVKDAGEFTITVAHDPSDLGQLAMEAAQASTSNFIFKVVLPDVGATAKYFLGLVQSQPLNIGGNDNVVRKNYVVAINSEIFTDI